MATLRQTFSDIASAIRAKGVSGTMKPIEMPDRIGEIKSLDEYGYLTFTAEEDTELTLVQNGGIAPHRLLKSSDGINWTKWENPATHGIVLNAGESVYLKADEDALVRTAIDSQVYNKIASTGKVGCRGDIRSIINMEPGIYDYWFRCLFSGSSITTPPELPAMKIVPNSYQYMFADCKSLTSAPELPATTLSSACYGNMFQGCTSLTNAPVLPARTMDYWCYSNMFDGCKSLTSAPDIRAEKLAPQCFHAMFNNCTSLTTAPELPVTTLANQCYWAMFYGCTSLTNAPALPATTLANQCYKSMFYNCTGLEYPQDILPATTLANWCYGYMFCDCIMLRKAPHLPATTLNDNCYERMFEGCRHLVEAPALPATTLAVGCYSHMFEGCSELRRVESDIPGSEDPYWQPEPGTILPEWVLPATSLSDWCYNCMFKGCTSLEVAPTIMATTTGGDYWDCFTGMFQGCSNLRRVKINLSEGVLSSGMFDGCTSLQLVDMTGATGIPRLSGTPVFPDGVDFYIVVPDELYDEWYMNESWLSVQDRIWPRTEWNETNPDDQV